MNVKEYSDGEDRRNNPTNYEDEWNVDNNPKKKKKKRKRPAPNHDNRDLM